MGNGTRRPWREGGILIREAEAEDAKVLGPQLAEADAAEIYAVVGLDPVPGLQLAYSLSDEIRSAVTDDENVVAMWGVAAGTEADPNAPCANIWLMCAPEIKQAPVAFSRIVRDQLKEFGDQFGLLYGWADARNADHVRWVKRLGFRVVRQDPEFGVEGRPFYEFIGVF